MKRIIAFLLIFAVSLTFCACGSKVPDGMNKETYRLGKETLKVMDDYLAGKIDIFEATDKFTVLNHKVGALSESLDAKAKVDGQIVDSEAVWEPVFNNLVGFFLTSFVLGMYGEEDNYGQVPDCQKQRDALASLLTEAADE